MPTQKINKEVLHALKKGASYDEILKKIKEIKGRKKPGKVRNLPKSPPKKGGAPKPPKLMTLEEKKKYIKGK